PCTGAQRRGLPTGHPSRPPAGAQVPPRCSGHRGCLVAPGGSARSRRVARSTFRRARLEALCCATLRAALPTARYSPRTLERVQGGGEVETARVHDFAFG